LKGLQTCDELAVPFSRFAMKRRRKMAYPRTIDLLTIEHAHEDVGIRMRDVAKWIAADKRIYINEL